MQCPFIIKAEDITANLLITWLGIAEPWKYHYAKWNGAWHNEDNHHLKKIKYYGAPADAFTNKRRWER